MSFKRVWSGYYAAWLGSNGRTAWPKPRKLYHSEEAWQFDRRPENLWDADGNDYVSSDILDGFAENGAGVVFTSKRREDVALVIQAGDQILSAHCRAWGLRREES